MTKGEKDMPRRSLSRCFNHGRERVHNADEIIADNIAKRLVEHLERAGLVVMMRPTEIGGAALTQGFEG